MLRDKGACFGAVSIVNHWVIAVLIIVLLAVGLYMVDLPKGGTARTEWIDFHKSVGILVLVLGVWRVLWRIVCRFPDDVATMPRWQEFAAKTMHILLLIAIVAMPVSGYMRTSMRGKQVSFFGLFDMPVLPQIEIIGLAAKEVHTWLAYILIVLIVLHVVAALKHHVFDKDATLKRMCGRAT